MGGKTVKNVSGYDVSKVMIGSLGTLGILGDITCRLLPLPEQVAAILISFATLAGAKAFSDRVLNSKLLPTSLEILNETAFGLFAFSSLKVPSGGWCVAAGLEGFDEEVNRELLDLTEMARLEKASEVVELDGNKAATFWKNLGNCLPAGTGKTVAKFKGSFLISQFAEILGAWAGASAGTNCALTCSAGLGLAYACVIGEPDIDIEKVAKLGEAFRAAAEQYGGSMIAESAPPALKQKLDPWGTPSGDFILMSRIKKNLDPIGVLNPGRFLGGL
jgi:glycolate oxidase FAD binding subunit